MRFSKLMLSVCALITMNGCAYIIPPEANAPRHNTVLGGPRRPQMNLVSGPLSSLTRAPETANFATAAPVEPVTIAAQLAPQSNLAAATTSAPSVQPLSATPALPPVDPAVKAQAERELTARLPRTIPPENQPFQVAGNYPPLDSVPPRPTLTGADSSQSRLNATQADLERGLVQAQQSKEALARDAAAEPSLLAPMPPAQTLAPAPSTPLPAATLPVNDRRAPIGNGAMATPAATPGLVANATPAPRIVLPDTPIITQFSVPTGPSFAPPAPLNIASLNTPQSQPVRMVPAQQPQTVNAPVAAPTAVTTSQRQPIVLRPPVPYEAAPVAAPAATPASSRGGITVRPGDFDPLAGA